MRVRTTLPFLGSRFESVRTITISDEVPGVSCRHTLTGYVRVRRRKELTCCSIMVSTEGGHQAVHAHIRHTGVLPAYLPVSLSHKG